MLQVSTVIDAFIRILCGKYVVYNNFRFKYTFVSWSTDRFGFLSLTPSSLWLAPHYTNSGVNPLIPVFNCLIKSRKNIFYVLRPNRPFEISSAKLDEFLTRSCVPYSRILFENKHFFLLCRPVLPLRSSLLALGLTLEYNFCITVLHNLSLIL